MPVEEIDDNEFDYIIAEKRHKELAGTLKGLVTILSKEKKDDDKVVAAIEKLSNKLNELKPQPFPKIPSPEVKVETNQSEVVDAVKKLSLDLLGELRKYNNKPIVDKYEFDFKRGYQNTGEIQKATVQVIYKK